MRKAARVFFTITVIATIIGLFTEGIKMAQQYGELCEIAEGEAPEMYSDLFYLLVFIKDHYSILVTIFIVSSVIAIAFGGIGLALMEKESFVGNKVKGFAITSIVVGALTSLPLLLAGIFLLVSKNQKPITEDDATLEDEGIRKDHNV
jgi:hypothetical protein